MFRFWASEHRGSDTAVEAPQPIAHLHKPLRPSILPHTTTITSSNVHPPKRRRQSDVGPDESLTAAAPAKRAKTQQEVSDVSTAVCDNMAHNAPATSDIDDARDEIRHHFGLEILLKHDELRLINQELAKCQVALEQLRRCHLIPYPVNCPTPDQMLDVSAGKGPALQAHSGEPVPRWAPPFGVTDGPYARHYAKWLIPDPSFDGIQPEWQFTPEATRARASFTEGRTTRNSFTDAGNSLKGRPVRGMGGQKLQSLSSGYPQPKEKAGPCVLKRADGQTVKLVCIDCNRENFSSTQGFINHCRIAHKRDFKSHEEAAVHSGHPIEVAEGGGIVGEEKAPTISSNSILVHPFARPDMTEQEAFVALRSRISDSLKLFNQGKLPGVTRIPSGPIVKEEAARIQDVKMNAPGSSPETPHLSRLMQSRKFTGNLRDLVADAKTKVSFEDITPGEESEVAESSAADLSDSKVAPPARTPVVMRVPAKATQPSMTTGPNGRPASSKGRAPPMSFVTPPGSTIGLGAKHAPDAILSDEDMDMEDVELSPNTMVSNNAPSLVSDDGEYDDSDDGSSVSGASDNLETESVSDVAEITIDDDQDPRSLRRGSNSVSGAVRLRKDDAKHVTFMSPIKANAKDRRHRKV
ncbi:Fc.00g100770.m01.CDS01 [Cosmosporella sp. VM-42]